MTVLGGAVGDDDVKPCMQGKCNASGQTAGGAAVNENLAFGK